MASPILCINSISAKGLGLKGVISCCSNNKGVYADVFISGYNKSPKQKTPIDKTGSTNPSWKVPMMFPINVDVPVAQARQTFVVKLKVVGFLGDKVIGQVHVPMVEVLKGYVDTKGENRMSCCVMIPGGYKGELDINFEFKELIAYDGADDGAVPVPVPDAYHQTPPAPAAQPKNPPKFRNVAAWIGAGAGVINAFIGIFAC